jgi:hypothetical protein
MLLNLGLVRMKSGRQKYDRQALHVSLKPGRAHEQFQTILCLTA